MDKDANKLGLGGMAIYLNDQVLAQFAKRNEGVSLLLAEILAVGKAVEIYKQRGWSKVCFLSDSHIVIEAINSTSSDPS